MSNSATSHDATVETDGRGAYAELTEAGLETLQAARLTHREGVRRYFLDRLNATEKIALGDIWTQAALVPPE